MIRSPLVAAAVREHQVRQTPDGVEVTLVAEGEVDEAALASAIEAGSAAPPGCATRGRRFESSTGSRATR